MRKKLLVIILALVAVCSFVFVACDNKTEFTITYACVEDATNPNTATTYKSDGSAIDLLPATKENATFVNWTYNGNVVTKVDPSWKQDITLVANWQENNCHIDLVWDLSEDYRFYYINEPYSANFYLFGKLLRVAPEVHLIYGEDNTDLYLPYYYPNFVQVDGFDSKTAGMKTVHIHAQFQGVDDQGQTIDYEADKYFDIEVKDYDHDKYGYTDVPEDSTVTWPDGFTLSANVKSPELVYAYNWMSSAEATDHADKCSHQSYDPYIKYTGSSAFTNTLKAPSPHFLPREYEQLKLVTIYEDLTRVYTREIKVSYAEQPQTQDGFAQLGECIFNEGETLDLAAMGIGKGTIDFYSEEDSIIFTFTNVEFVAQDYISDFTRSSLGFQYFFTENKNVTVNIVGNNYITQPYYRDSGYGNTFSIQHLADGDEDCIVTITGDGVLNLCGGGTALYIDCPLEIDTTLNISSYLNRRTNAINAYAVHLTNNAKLRANNIGTVMLAMAGRILIDEDAQVNCVVTMPHLDKSRDMLNVIQASGDIMIRSKSFYISVRLPEDTYGKGEGMDSCILIQSFFGDVYLEGVVGELRIFALFESNSHPKFDTAIAIATGEDEKRDPNTGIVSIKNCNLYIDLHAELFNTVYGIYAIKTLEIEGSTIDMSLHCLSGLNGLFCSKGNIKISKDVETPSVINIVGTRTNEQAYAFGIYADNGITVEDSAVDVNFNKGIALIAFKQIQGHPETYQDGYVPTKLVGFDNVDYVSIASINVAPGQFVAYETVYKTDGTNYTVSNSFSIDNRAE